MGSAAKPCRFGRHVWKVIEKTEQPSAIELMRSSGITEAENVRGDVAVRRFVVTYRCDRCGSEDVRRV